MLASQLLVLMLRAAGSIEALPLHVFFINLNRNKNGIVYLLYLSSIIVFYVIAIYYVLYNVRCFSIYNI